MTANVYAGVFSLPYERAEAVQADLESLWIEVSIQQQCLCLRQGTRPLAIYPISSATKGTGQEFNSYATPLGFHRIFQKIGEKASLFTIFKSKKNTKKIWTPESHDPSQDYVLTRIFVLEGLEKGFNKGRDSNGVLVDSKDRFIYIHGTAEEDRIGYPASHGCLRMKNRDIVELFDLVETGATVWIHQGPLHKDSPSPNT